MKECQLSDLEVPGLIALSPTPCDGGTGRAARATESGMDSSDLESLVKS